MSAAASAPVVVATPEEEEASFFIHFLAGTFGGIFGLTLCYPLDTIKVRLQTSAAGTYTGLRHVFRTVVATEGVGALYRGLISPVFGYGLIKATAFASYNEAKKQRNAMEKRNGHVGSASPFSLLELAMCGAFAGFCQTFVRAPVEQIKVVMQASNSGKSGKTYANTLACIRDVFATEGVRRGFFRSFFPTLAREIPQYALYYPTYEVATKAFCAPGQTVDTLSPLMVAVAGGTAGVVQWFPTLPFDVIKSRISAAPPGFYNGAWDCAVRSYKAEGAGVFFRGLTPALIRAFPLHGAVFLGYEMSMKIMHPKQ